jgi:hypothetical protein
MLPVLLRKACLIEYELRFGFCGIEDKANDRVITVAPITGAPRLNDALVGHELDVATQDHSAKAGERAAGHVGDFSRSTAGKRLKLGGIGERRIDALRAGLESDFLMDGRGLDVPFFLSYCGERKKNCNTKPALFSWLR